MTQPIPIQNNLIHLSPEGHPVFYKRYEELGHGGFAKVFRAVNSTTGEEVAIKITSKERLKKPKAEQKHKTEVAIQMSLDHPNVVKALDFFQDVHYTYLVLELCPGGSLKSLLRKKGRFSEDEAVKYLHDILNGLSYLHDNRIIHRDLKLDNFLIDKDGNIKIADFGLSAKLNYDDERKHSICGTPNYISPELLMNAKKGISYEVDIWAVGVSTYGMLFGSLPFQTKHTKDTYENIKKCNYKFPDDIEYSLAAKSFIQSVLQLDPEMRPTALECQNLSWLRQRRPKDIQKISYSDKNNNSFNYNYNTQTANNILNEPKKIVKNDENNLNNDNNINLITSNNTREKLNYTTSTNILNNNKYGINDENKNINLIEDDEKKDKNELSTNVVKRVKLVINDRDKLSQNTNLNIDSNLKPNLNPRTSPIIPKDSVPITLKPSIKSNNTADENSKPTDLPQTNNIVTKVQVPIKSSSKENNAQPEKMQMPKYLVSRFCDHNGLGYLLLNGCVGACFKDGTRMVFDPHQTFIQYWETYQDPAPKILEIDGPIETKKISILFKFSSSLKKTPTMFQIPQEKFDPNVPMLHVKYWMRTEEVTLFRMNDRNIQLNFTDRRKLIIFWNIRKLMTVSSIHDYGELHRLHDVSKRPDGDDEKRRLDIAKHLLSIMSRGTA